MDPRDMLVAHQRRADPVVPEYAAELVLGVSEHIAEIDEILAQRSTGWTVERMPAVDRNVLRLGVFEILHCPDVPGGVAVNEAVELSRELSTDESPSFVNGVLGAVLDAIAES